MSRVLLTTTQQCLLAKTAMEMRTPISILGMDYLISRLEIRRDDARYFAAIPGDPFAFTGAMELVVCQPTPEHAQPPAAQLTLPPPGAQQ